MGFTTATVGGKVTAAMYNEHASGVRFYKAVDITARDAIVGMAEGDYCLVTGTGVKYVYTGSAWVFAEAASIQIVPSSATNGSVSSVGVVTSTAQTLVRVRDAFPTSFRVFEIDYDLTTSAASSINARLAVDATDAATAYDNQRFSAINATAAAVQALNATEIQISPIALIGRHVGRIVLTNPNQSDATYFDAAGVISANPMTTSAGLVRIAGLHRTLTAYNSFTIIAASGNVTVNRLTVKGVS